MDDTSLSHMMVWFKEVLENRNLNLVIARTWMRWPGKLYSVPCPICALSFLVTVREVTGLCLLLLASWCSVSAQATATGKANYTIISSGVHKNIIFFPFRTMKTSVSCVLHVTTAWIWRIFTSILSLHLLWCITLFWILYKSKSSSTGTLK